MKSTIKGKAELPKPFPKLMKSTHITILFTSERVGTVVHVEKGHDYNYLGEFDRQWHPTLFTDFEGTVELSNED